MNPFTLPRPVRLALIALLPFTLCPAQDSAAPKPAKPVAIDPYLVTIDFPGGPLSKLTAKLNESGDPKLSIVQSIGLDPVLPAFSVSNVRVDAVIAALGRIVEPQGYHLMPIGQNLAVLSKIEDGRPPAFASLQLDRKLETPSGISAEEIVAAIQQGCEFANSGRPSTLRFKYHPGTKLLFVSGTAQEVDIAYKVFASLPDGPKAGDPAPTPQPAPKK